MSSLKTNHIARLDNTFVDNARYQLTAREAKVILYLISKINPLRQSELNEQIISVKELETILKGDGKKWGGLYREMENFQSRMMDRKISIPNDIEIDGKLLPGKMNWFQYISTVRMEDGNVGLSFLFSQPLQAAFLDLKKYVAIDLLDVIPLKSAFSIRMFQIFKAYRNMMSKHQKRSVKYYGIHELKSILGVADKYADFSNFRKRVLSTLEKEINKHTFISVKYKTRKAGRTVVGIEFEFWDTEKRTTQRSKSASLKFSNLTFAQTRAFDRLVAYGVKEQIVLEMILRIKGSEIVGFEDWYMEEAIKIFEVKTNQTDGVAKAGTLVNWFLKKKIFEQGDHFARIMEQLQDRKKKMQKERPTAWDNRLVAKGMTYQAFMEQLNK